MSQALLYQGRHVLAVLLMFALVTIASARDTKTPPRPQPRPTPAAPKPAKAVAPKPAVARPANPPAKPAVPPRGAVPPKPPTVQKHLNLQAADDMVVRLREPPLKYDEKGLILRYTAKELKELRGDGKLPGYPGDFANLKNGQTVLVFLARSDRSLYQPEVRTDTKKEPAKDNKDNKDNKATSSSKDAAKKDDKPAAPMHAGALMGRLTKVDESNKKLTLRIETPAQPGQPAADPKELLKDLHATMIVILKD